MGATFCRDRDATLVVKACAGDRSAFDALVTRHRGYVYRLAYGLCKDPEITEDVCVEAFCEAYRALPSYRGEAQFRVWLHQIAVNVSLEHLRQVRRWRRHLPEGGPVEELPIVDIPELAVTNTCAAQVQQAMQSLPEAQKTAVCMYYLEGRSCAEIAARLQVPRSTVKTRLFYGTKALREMLEAQAIIAAPARGGSHAEL